ncbi:hypothetical protein MetexDRAFT_3471 [Methylorubrum extorquens DSM 13060]|uniref:Transposase IS3/IS911 family protein n=1 Tax=Methylorubrum extorquens DSM 13060 TaxID=882800 RepID=H1KLF9_METEX|nr:hypothetical protein MetexDRAFT_3471 [Methylorubrum extorquens DSM 13060]
MRRGQKTSAEQVVLKLRQIEVQTAQGKSLALACKEAVISEQKLRDECLRQEIFYSLKEARDCQEFRVRAAIVDPMEVLDGTTQSTPYP